MRKLDQNEVFDYYQEVARSAFADMLHDTERNRKYAIGLEKSIKLMKSQGRKANVLDIGTGTGLLAMLASSYGADSVVTLEAFSPVSHVARKIIEENGFKDKIKIINKHSTRVEVGPGKDMEQKANILVAEVLDTELIGEGAIKTYNHAHANLMEKDCLAVPESASIYVQIVDSDLITSWNTFQESENVKCPANVSNCSGVPSIHDLQLSQIPTEFFKSLTNPIKVCEFDFTGKTEINAVESFETSCEIIRDGRASGAFFWWDIKMCFDQCPILSCAPFWAHPDRDNLKERNDEKICNLIPWRDHWMQACFYLKSDGKISKNSILKLLTTHDEFSWWINVISENDKASLQTKPSCSCLFHLTNSRNRIKQINNISKRMKFFETLCEVMNECESVLFVGDNNFIALEESEKFKSKFLLQKNPHCYENMKNFIEFNKSNVKLVSELSEIKDENITRIVCDPYFDNAVLPWDNFIEFWKIVQQQNVCHVNPMSAKIFAVPVHFLNLHKIRWPLKSSCEGFNHEIFDDVIEFASSLADENVEPFSLWEYPCKALGPSKAIYKMTFQKDKNKMIEKNEETTLEIVKRDESCNGIAFWIEWQIDENEVIACGPDDVCRIGELINWKMDERQAIHLIPYAKVNQVERVVITTTFSSDDITMDFTYCHQQNDL